MNRTTRASRKTGKRRGRPCSATPLDVAVTFRTTAAAKAFIDSNGGATHFINALINSAMITAMGTK